MVAEHRDQHLERCGGDRAVGSGSPADPLGQGWRRREDDEVEQVPWLGGTDAPRGVGPHRASVRGQADAPAGALLDPVVPTAQAHEVRGGGGAGGPGPDVVEVAEPSRHRAPGEPAATIPRTYERGEAGVGTVGRRRRGRAVEQRSTAGMAWGRARRAGVMDGADPSTTDEHRLTRDEADDLDEILRGTIEPREGRG